MAAAEFVCYPQQCVCHSPVKLPGSAGAPGLPSFNDWGIGAAIVSLK
jgi:hypothetical protein